MVRVSLTRFVAESIMPPQCNVHENLWIWHNDYYNLNYQIDNLDYNNHRAINIGF